jgi:hypothetical protein
MAQRFEQGQTPATVGLSPTFFNYPPTLPLTPLICGYATGTFASHRIEQ